MCGGWANGFCSHLRRRSAQLNRTLKRASRRASNAAHQMTAAIADRTSSSAGALRLGAEAGPIHPEALRTMYTVMRRLNAGALSCFMHHATESGLLATHLVRCIGASWAPSPPQATTAASARRAHFLREWVRIRRRGPEPHARPLRAANIRNGIPTNVLRRHCRGKIAKDWRMMKNTLRPTEGDVRPPSAVHGSS